jgi:hypothetical protein
MRRLVLALAFVTAPALARGQSTIRQRSGHHRPADLSILLGVPVPFGFGAGMRFGIPLVQEGFIGSINDAIFLEPGFQFVYWSDFDHHQIGFQVPVLMRWDFFLSTDWTVFGSIGPVFGFWLEGAAPHGAYKIEGKRVFDPGGPPGFFAVNLGGGAFWNFSRDTALRFDASTSMLAIGFVFRL